MLERNVAKVHDRRHVSPIQRQNRGEILDRLDDPCLRRARYAALVEQKCPLARRVRYRQERLEERLRFASVAAFEQRERALSRRHGQRSSREQRCEPPKHYGIVFTIDVVTLFPEVFAPFVGLSIVGAAVEAGIVDIRYHHLLDALDDSRRADDAPFGGGAGMVLRLEPIARVLDGLLADAAAERRAIVVPSPAGQPFTQSSARRLATLEHVIFVCGHYEGIDERLGALYPIEEYSLGDFVVTGGEIPTLAFMDATVRLVEGVLDPASREPESFTQDALDYPCYTRPAVFRGVAVPEVLLSGNHAAIAAWRREESRRRTAARRGSAPG